MTALIAATAIMITHLITFYAGRIYERASRPLLGSGECAAPGCARNPTPVGK